MVAGASFGWTGMSLIVAGTPRERTGRLLVAGPAMMALGLLGVALLMPLEPAPITFPAIALVGAGIGACWAFIAQRVMSGARAGEEDLAASSVATVQQTGFALGAALAGLVANAAGLSSGLSRTDIAEAAFWVPTSFVAAAVAATIMGSRLARHWPAARD
jgi:predicted MFS family arabinose efflux permease